MMPQIVVNLLSGPEVMTVGQNLLDGGSLSGLALSPRRLGLRIRFGGLVVISMLLGGFGRAAQCSS
jgi:hypothetical protein